MNKLLGLVMGPGKSLAGFVPRFRYVSEDLNLQKKANQIMLSQESQMALWAKQYR